MHLLILMNIIWSAAYVFMKWGLNYLSPMHLLFLRMFVALVVLLLISRRQWIWIKGRDLWRCVAMGAIIAIAHTLGFIGIDKSYSVDAAILYAIEPITAIVWARILLKEKMSVQSFSALILALIGFVILSDISFNNLFLNMASVGNVIMLLGVFADGLYSPVAKPAAEKYPARVLLAHNIFFTTIFILPLALAAPVRQASFSWQAVASVLYLSILCTCLGWTLWLYFLKKLPVNVIALTIFIQPVIGPFISYFTLGEEIGFRVIAGGSIILSAVFIAISKKRPSIICEHEA